MPTLYPTRLRFSHSFTHPWSNRFRPACDSRVDPARALLDLVSGRCRSILGQHPIYCGG